MHSEYFWVDDHQITFEDLSGNWSHYVIHAEKFLDCIGTVIVYETP